MKKARTFRHLVHEDRDRIAAGLRRGETKVEIADNLGVHKATVTREIEKRKQHSGRYNPARAQHKANVLRGRSKYQGMKVESLPAVKAHIIQELKRKRSPDEIAGRLRLVHGHTIIGKDAIYNWLYSAWGQQYCRYLCSRRYTRKKHTKKTSREMIPNRIPLCERPLHGVHGQGDLLVSPQRAHTTASAAVVCEEETKYLVGTKVPNRKPRVVSEAFERSMEALALDTLTLDNGIENKAHERLSVPAYFCDPHAPWQKPLVEQSIGLLRRWFLPKGTDLSTVSEAQLQEYIAVLNGKYRRSLGYRSSGELAFARGIIKKTPSLLNTLASSEVAFHPRI